MKPERSLSIFGLVRAHPGRLAVLCAWSAVASVPALVGGRLVASAVDEVLSGDHQAAALWLSAMAAAAVIHILASKRQWLTNGALQEDVRFDLTNTVVAGSLAAAMDEPQRLRRGGAEITDQIEAVKGGIFGLGTQIPGTAATLMAVAGIATVEPLLSLVLAPFVVTGVAMVPLYGRLLSRRMHDEVVTREHVTDVAAGTLDGVRDIVACGGHLRASREAARALAAARRATVARGDLTAVSHIGLSAVLNYAPLVIVIALVPWLVGRGSITVGEAIGAVTYVQTGLGQAGNLLEGLVELAIHTRINLRRLDERLRPPPGPRRDGPVPRGSDIVVRDLRFAYSASAHPIVDGLDLSVPAGDHLAVVGPSGIGKSTVAALLAGVLHPDAGQVLLGGVPVAEIDDAVRSRHIAIVAQESYVFAGTLRENLTYLNPGATDDDLERAADAVGLDRVLRRLGGLDAAVETTTGGLSEGERQLISLTRVHLSPAPIVILDEATCYLDPVAEQRAEQAFEGQGRTLIVIAHRMTSSLRARRVLVMDGTSVMVGSHEELLGTNALYADLHGLWGGEAEHPHDAAAGELNTP